ncbi:solute carrier family 25 member 40 isoform X2 [Agrilus planipennis]|uniref:Solute carrier family 25 member 40 isoform X2 n=1 Tax=Agrilus planipennis TaxID=224129 RepID=A0A1W4WJ88_AGRPL|nr:solute carrier family 25 member 40 isoform X2 [Agrilus planipennis]
MHNHDVDIDDEQFRTTPLQQAAASCTGALLTSLFVTPLDVVKIRLQAQQTNSSKCFLYCNGLMDHICGCQLSNGEKEWFTRPGHFNGTIDAFVKIARNEGVASLWSGLSPTLVLAVPATVVYFVTYEQLRLFLKDYYNEKRTPGDPYKQPIWIPLISGASARVLAATTVSPLELIRTKMQSRKLSYFELGETLRLLIKQDGITGLWRGILPTLLRDVPFSALYWTQYETLKKFYGPGVPSFSFSFMAGALAGAVASVITLPFDVVKTHQQIAIGGQLYGGEAKKETTIEIIRKIYSQHGVKGLFVGITPRVVKVAPACAIMIATFEHAKVLLSRKIQVQEKLLQKIPKIPPSSTYEAKKENAVKRNL